MKKIDQHIQAGQYGLGTWEGSLITEGGPALVSPEERHLIFILNMDIFLLLVNVPFSLVIKAKIQYMFARPQTGCYRWPKIQVNSCISQNDFPLSQYVNISLISSNKKDSLYCMCNFSLSLRFKKAKVYI